MKNKSLSILFSKDGFSFSVWHDNQLLHAHHFELKNEDSLADVLSENLLLQQTFQHVSVSILTTQFNIVPKVLYEKDSDSQKWLEFNAEVFEHDVIEYANLNHDAKLVYAFPQILSQQLRTKFGVKHIQSASEIFINSIESSSEKAQFFVNFHPNTIEITVVSKDNLMFYNLYAITCKEDVLYYILNAYKQLQLDPNEIELYYFGNPAEETLKMLMNFVRHVMPGIADKTLLHHYTEFKTTK